MTDGPASTRNTSLTFLTLVLFELLSLLVPVSVTMMINMINFTWFIRPSRMILDHDGRVWKINGLRPDERASVLQFLTLVMRTRVSTLHDPDLSHAIQTISNGTIKKRMTYTSYCTHTII